MHKRCVREFRNNGVLTSVVLFGGRVTSSGAKNDVPSPVELVPDEEDDEPDEAETS